MIITRAADAPTWDLPGAHFTGLASPSRGESRDISVWRVVLDPHTDGVEHQLTSSEIFTPLAGTAQVRIGGGTDTIGVGDALVVPADTAFSISNPADEVFEAVVCLPAGAQAAIAGGEPFTPEWAA